MYNRKVAVIEEINCVGCSKCLNACPVDAIVGSLNKIHTILINACIGCDICINICPTDCIKIKNRLFINYIVKNINMDSLSVKIKDISKKELMHDSRSRYKKKVLRISEENKKNLLFYQKKKQLLESIRKEIQEIILNKTR